MAHSKKAVVSGGGPVGAFAAIALASQGWEVQVFEKWDLPISRPPAGDSRAYLLNLTSRALRGFKRFGVNVDPLVAPHNGMLGQTFYGSRGQVLRSFSIPVTDPPTNLRVFRDEIARQLISEAQRLFPHRIDFHFNSPVQAVDVDKQTVTVEGESSQQVHYDLLVAADGAGSVVRAHLAKSMPEGYVRRIRHKVVYSTIGLRPPADQVPDHAFFQVHQFEAGAIFWNGRGDGDVRAGLFIEQQQADDIRAGNSQWVHDYLANSLPALPQCAKKAVADLVESRPHFHPLSGWTHVKQLHGHKVEEYHETMSGLRVLCEGRHFTMYTCVKLVLEPSVQLEVVLLGDAAHTMTPVLGQGLNCGLEDVIAFAETVQQHAGDIDAALPAYNHARWPDVEAMLNINELVARHDYTLVTKETIAHKLWLLGHGLLLKTHVATHTLLHRLLPDMFSEASMTQMLKGQVPYRAVMQSMYRDGMVLAGLTAVAVAGSVHLVRSFNVSQP